MARKPNTQPARNPRSANAPTHLLFAGSTLVASGDLLTVALALQAYTPAMDGPAPLAFEVASGRQIDIDVRGHPADLQRRLALAPDTLEPALELDLPKGRGRPKLGVIGREVTLLPRHWSWLEAQRGGASAALRRLVDEARQAHADSDRVRVAQDRSHHFMAVVAGDLPGYEEATRALFAGNRSRFMAETRRWPKDIRHCARGFAAAAFTQDPA